MLPASERAKQPQVCNRSGQEKRTNQKAESGVSTFPLWVRKFSIMSSGQSCFRSLVHSSLLRMQDTTVVLEEQVLLL